MINFELSNNGISAINVSFLAGRSRQLGYTNGVSNLASQMLLNGSKSYEKKHLIHKPLEFGGAINIGVSDMFTSINARCLSSKTREMLDMVFSMIFESNFNDIEKQKKIVRELNSNTMNDPYKVLLDRLHNNASDEKFTSLRLDNNFNDITVDEVKRFHDENYINPSISIIASDNTVLGYVRELMDKYNVSDSCINNKSYLDTFKTSYDEFKWNVTTNNRLLISFVADKNPIYDILTSVYQYRINKLIRMEKGICCRNRCILLPLGTYKKIFIIDIEFSKYENKDEIVNDVMNIINDGYTKKEFEISKSQIIGNILYNLCDPVKNTVMNSERTLLGQSDARTLIKELENCSYEESKYVQKNNFTCTIGVR